MKLCFTELDEITTPCKPRQPKYLQLQVFSFIVMGYTSAVLFYKVVFALVIWIETGSTHLMMQVRIQIGIQITIVYTVSIPNQSGI